MSAQFRRNSPPRKSASRRSRRARRRRVRRPRGVGRAGGSLSELHRGLSRQLPRAGLPLISHKKSARWSPRLLVIGAILFTLDASGTLGERFAAAYDAIVEMFPSRRRPGTDPQGFLRALCRHSDELLDPVTRRLRRRVRRLAGRTHWRVGVGGRWAAFGVDGSRVECPRTAANEKALGCAGRTKTGPQLFLTTLFHVGTGLIWAFRRGPGTAGERDHLLQMLDTLPGDALLLADAGFTGYDFMGRVLQGHRHLLIRVGGNVSLLRELGWCCREDASTVYLWPDQAQRKAKSPPLVLRLITLRDGRNRCVHLLTDVLEQSALSDREAGQLYARRWGVEVLYRSLKQTMGRRRMACGNPAHAGAELDWAVVGLWGLSLMAAEEVSDAGRPPTRLSVAKALRPVRRAIRSATPRHGSGGGMTLARQLSLAVRDEYVRTRPKGSRNPVNKKKDPLPKAPRARTATPREKARARALLRRISG